LEQGSVIYGGPFHSSCMGLVKKFPGDSQWRMIRNLSKRDDEGQSTNRWVDSDKFPTIYLLLHGSVIMWVPHPLVHFLFPSLFFPLGNLVAFLSLLWHYTFLSGCPWWEFLECPLGMQCFFHFTSMMSHGLLFALMASRPVVFPAGCFVIFWPVGLDDDWPVGPAICGQ